MKKDAIMLISNNNNINYLKQVILSAKINANWKGDFIILIDNVDEKKLRWYKKNNITILNLPPPIKKDFGKWPRIVFYKYYLLHPIMKKWNKIIYLDADIIILRNIDNLLKIKGFGAAYESRYSPLTHQIRNKNPQTYKKLKSKYNLRTKSFNSGVLVVNTKMCSNEKFEDLIKLTKKYWDIIWFPEQAILNFYFYKKFERISFAYNDTYPADKHVFDAYYFNHKIKSAILHFYTDYKPWNRNNVWHKEWLKNNNYDFKETKPKIIQTTKLDELTTNFRYFFLVKIQARIGRVSGSIGQKLKSRNKKLYYFLKRFI